jgi:MT0933-like antitoxin protein
MPDFMDEAKKLAGEHPDLVDKGLDQVEQEAENRTGGRFDSQIQGAEQQAEGYLGTDQQGGDPNQQGDPNQSQNY